MPREKVPMKMWLSIPQALVIQFSRPKTRINRLRYEAHFDQKRFFLYRLQLMKLGNMLLPEKKRVPSEELKITQHDVAGLRLRHEMPISSGANCRDSLTNEARVRIRDLHAER